VALRHYCTFEDRPDALIGVKLLALSLERHCRNFQFWIALRNVPDGFWAWIEKNAPNAKVIVFEPRHGTWNIKAEIITHFLSEVSEEVIWIDSDILVLRDLEELWPRCRDDVVVAQEYNYPAFVTSAQVEAFGLPPLTTLPHAVNSCVLRFTRSHVELLRFWGLLLGACKYQTEQQKPFAQRARGLRSDQDVLEYILSTVRPDARCSVSYVRTGFEIIQDHGSTTYDFHHRLMNAFGFGHPFFVHALGEKPWGKSFRRKDSAYVELARIYREFSEEWFNDSRDVGWFSKTCPVMAAHLLGMPRCLAGKIWRFLSTGSFRRKLD